jgi:hypothetical protein
MFSKMKKNNGFQQQKSYSRRKDNEKDFFERVEDMTRALVN